MRLLTPALAAVALLAAQTGPGLVSAALAQTATAPAPMPPASMPPAAPPAAAALPGTSVPETTAPAPANMAPATTAPIPKSHKARHGGKRMSMHQRFASANSAQDGHLTLDQARAGKWTYAVRNFSAIDRDHKGYITESDIHAFAHARYMARHAMAAPAGAAPAAGAASVPAPSTPAPAQ